MLPGHGPATTIGRERGTNPYLVEVAAMRPGESRGLRTPPAAGCERRR